MIYHLSFPDKHPLSIASKNAQDLAQIRGDRYFLGTEEGAKLLEILNRHFNSFEYQRVIERSDQFLQQFSTLTAQERCAMIKLKNAALTALSLPPPSQGRSFLPMDEEMADAESNPLHDLEMKASEQQKNLETEVQNEIKNWIAEGNFMAAIDLCTEKYNDLSLSSLERYRYGILKAFAKRKFTDHIRDYFKANDFQKALELSNIFLTIDPGHQKILIVKKKSKLALFYLKAASDAYKTGRLFLAKYFAATVCREYGTDIPSYDFLKNLALEPATPLALSTSSDLQGINEVLSHVKAAFDSGDFVEATRCCKYLSSLSLSNESGTHVRQLLQMAEQYNQMLWRIEGLLVKDEYEAAAAQYKVFSQACFE